MDEMKSNELSMTTSEFNRLSMIDDSSSFSLSSRHDSYIHNPRMSSSSSTSPILNTTTNNNNNNTLRLSQNHQQQQQQQQLFIIDNIDEIQNQLWQGYIPCEFTMDPKEVTNIHFPKPIFLMCPRMSYFPIAAAEALLHFQPYAPAVLGVIGSGNGSSRQSKNSSNIKDQKKMNNDNNNNNNNDHNDAKNNHNNDKSKDSNNHNENNNNNNENSPGSHNNDNNNRITNSPPAQRHIDQSSLGKGNHKINQGVWFECRRRGSNIGIPLKWHWPIGLLYDLIQNTNNSKSNNKNNNKSNNNNNNNNNRNNLVNHYLGEWFDDEDIYNIHNNDLNDDESILPWQIVLHFQGFPGKKLLHMEGDGIQHCQLRFLNTLKQSLFLSHGKAQWINENDMEDIWKGIIQNKQEYYRQGVKNSKVIITQPKYIPVRLILAYGDTNTNYYTLQPSLLNKSGETLRHVISYYLPGMINDIKMLNENGKEWVLTLGLENKDIHIDNDEDDDGNKNSNYNHDNDNDQDEEENDFIDTDILLEQIHMDRITAITQGIRLPLDSPICGVWESLSYPDNFLYLAISIRGRY